MTCKKGALQIPRAAALVMTASTVDRPGDEIERKASGLGRTNRYPRPELQKPTKLQISRAAALVMTASSNGEDCN
jgi:hypothetical protein